MSFTDGMPKSGDSLGNTRIPFVNELAGIRSTMKANHIDQNATGAGKHAFCQFVDSAPGLTSHTELALFNKSNGTAQRFFMQQIDNGTNIQLSGIDPISSATAGCTFLPGGLLLQWGGGTTDGSGNTTDVVFAKDGASGFKLLSIIGLSLKRNDVAYGFNFNSETTYDDGFKFVVGGSSGRGKEFGYCVIGTMA